MFGVAGLSADSAFILALRGWRFGRLDDVGRRGLGGGRRILSCRGQLLPQLSDSGLERLQLRLAASNFACNRRQFEQDFVPWISWRAML